METNTLDNQSRRERFERIKAECRSQAKRRLRLYAVFTLTFIAFLIIAVVVLNRVHVIPTCMLLFFVISFVWSAVINYRFLQRLDNLETPEELLHCFEKRLSDQRNPDYLTRLVLFGLIISPFPEFYRDRVWMWAALALAVTYLAILIYSYFKGDFVPYKTRRDEEILSRLENLVENK